MKIAKRFFPLYQHFWRNAASPLDSTSIMIKYFYRILCLKCFRKTNFAVAKRTLLNERLLIASNCLPLLL